MHTQKITIVVLLYFFIVATTPTHAAPGSDLQLEGAGFWIGDVGPAGPLFTGPHQYPFICYTLENGLGQPLIDNIEGIGNAVFPEINGIPDFNALPVGYSKNCGIHTRVDYFYYSTIANNFLPLPDPTNIPNDVAMVQVKNQQQNFIVRLERGTLNRFIYSIAMLAPYPESLHSPKTLNNRAWNRKLVYKFQGGVGIGHWQGELSLSRRHALHYDALKRGYAVAYSTGTKTSTHYNLRLAEETALMVKQHFIAIYGTPRYTIGIGASGGAIQQYIIAQNNPKIIDGAIPQMSYPDMITQTIHVADCELLERYFDFEYMQDPTSRWGDWLQRTLIEGMTSNNSAIVLPWSLSPHAPIPGASECVNGWRGEVAALFNPQWTHPDYIVALQLYRYPLPVIAGIKWTHWNDLGNIYPQDAYGVAYTTWDNVGIQYGLTALQNGDINVGEFLEINACVGGWKPPQEMVLGKYPWDPNGDPLEFDPWNQANMNLNPLCQFGQAAPRSEGNLAAMNAAYTSGHVFTGTLKIPVIDIRWYLEPILDMHHSRSSFVARARMLKNKGHADNQVIWFVECSDMDPVTLDEDCAYDPTGYALDTIDRWLAAIKEDDQGNPEENAQIVIKHKPETAVDACFYGDGSLLYAGDDAWDGILNNKPAGICKTMFPIYGTSRTVAGGAMTGDVFKCALKPVGQALSDGTYGNAIFNPIQIMQLYNIFPEGVCNFSQPDLALESNT